MRGTRLPLLHSHFFKRIIPARAGNTLQGAPEMATARIIPARAGNTLFFLWPYLRVPDHPRACGEHFRESRPEPHQVGSSPRVRGTPQSAQGSNERCRIIPARAGNTKTRFRRAAHAPDHPRACGEHCGACGTVWWMRRIIPARAGNTSGCTLTISQRADHPRACGEHRSYRWAECCGRGSSPRVRGTRIT